MGAPAVETSFSWLRQIPGSLFALDAKPLLGYPPAFPWKTFATLLEKALQISPLAFQTEPWTWHHETTLLSGLGEQIKGFRMTLAPLSGPLWWGMPEQDLLRLMAFLLGKEQQTAAQASPPLPNQIEEEYLEAFYRFIAMEGAAAFTSVDFDKTLSPLLGQEESLPTEPCLCMDLAFSIGNQTFRGRLFLSNEFRSSWAQRFLTPKNAMDRLFYLGMSLETPISLQIGRVSLPASEWKQASVGDLVALDSCTFDPVENKGHLLLTINGTPYFRGELQQGNIKILEHSSYYEVDMPMDKPADNTPHEDTSHEDSENEGLHDEDFDISDEEFSEIETEEEPVAEEQPQKAPPAAAVPEASAAEPQTAPSIDDIPLNIVVEVGRIQMSIKKLLELQPGNMLELDLHPEAGVDLVVNGKRIAKGEILRIGDVLGVRIIQFV